MHPFTKFLHWCRENIPTRRVAFASMWLSDYEPNDSIREANGNREHLVWRWIDANIAGEV